MTGPDEHDDLVPGTLPYLLAETRALAVSILTLRDNDEIGDGEAADAFRYGAAQRSAWRMLVVLDEFTGRPADPAERTWLDPDRDYPDDDGDATVTPGPADTG